MAHITLTIPDRTAGRVIAAICRAGGLPPSADNARKVLEQHVKQTVFNVERQDAEQAALERVPDPKVDDLFDVDSGGETPDNRP